MFNEMPVSQKIEEKYINGVKVDKEDDKIFFCDETHTYYDKESMQKYISVTSLISKYAQEFDEDFWSAYKALEQIADGDVWSNLKPLLLNTRKFKMEYLKQYNINEQLFKDTQQKIKDDYERTRNESCQHGVDVHLKKELSFYGNTEFDFRKYGFENLCGKFDCKQDYYKLDLQRGVYPEFLISANFDGLTICGQIDILVIDGMDVYIADWKSNKEIKKTSYYNSKTKKHIMMKFPVNNLMDTNLYHYYLQLSMYARMLQQRNPDYNIKQLQIIHIDRNDKQTLYEVPYLKTECEKIIKDYSRKLKIEQQLDRITPYKF